MNAGKCYIPGVLFVLFIYILKAQGSNSPSNPNIGQPGYRLTNLTSNATAKLDNRTSKSGKLGPPKKKKQNTSDELQNSVKNLEKTVNGARKTIHRAQKISAKVGKSIQVMMGASGRVSRSPRDAIVVGANNNQTHYNAENAPSSDGSKQYLPHYEPVSEQKSVSMSSPEQESVSTATPESIEAETTSEQKPPEEAASEEKPMPTTTPEEKSVAVTAQEPKPTSKSTAEQKPVAAATKPVPVAMAKTEQKSISTTPTAPIVVAHLKPTKLTLPTTTPLSFLSLVEKYKGDQNKVKADDEKARLKEDIDSSYIIITKNYLVSIICGVGIVVITLCLLCSALSFNKTVRVAMVLLAIGLAIYLVIHWVY